jgi:uncharacterized membrane protein/predicted DsbA family dithiol-disulfide isomerase
VRRILSVLALRLSLLAAILASAVLVVDYRNVGDPAFCGEGSGCMAVRFAPTTRQLQELLGLPLPTLGLVVYAALMVASLYATTRAVQRGVAAVATLGGLAGAALLFIQVSLIGVLCPWCVVVDIASIGAATAAVLAARWAPGMTAAEREALFGGRARLLSSSLAGAAVALPFVWGAFPVVPPAPPSIVAEQTPGKLTIVSFTDFECPFCRRLHPVMQELEHEYRGRLVLKRRMKPLRSHRGARPAALAYLCAPEAACEALATALYTMDAAELTPAGIGHAARGLNLDSTALEECMRSPEAEARLAQDEAMFDALGQAGLPRTYVGARVVLGYNPSRLRELVVRELQGNAVELPAGALIGLLALGFAGLAIDTWRRARL